MSLVHEIQHELLKEKKVQLFVLRLDLFQPEIGGNKYFKLKYNLEKAKTNNYSSLLSFGGAYSNHISALAAAGKTYGFKTIGIIRGNELNPFSNPTLELAGNNGMSFHFVNRETYREKNHPNFIEFLHQKFGEFYLIPEGGTNTLALKGCKEITQYIPFNPDVICCAVGTGGTIAGINLSLRSGQQLIGVPVLKNAFFLENDIKTLQQNYFEVFGYEKLCGELKLIYDYHFGGYAKLNEELIRFKNNFYDQNGIKLDSIYTSKLFYAILDLIKKNYFESGKKIVVIHTGGLQGDTRIN